MKLIFMGSPEAVTELLGHLLDHCQLGQDHLIGVVSQPSRPSGRKQLLCDPPVATFAKTHNLKLWQPAKASSPDFLTILRAEAPDVIITAAYGQILSDAFLQIPTRATINVHPSMLPAYRGATPVPAALLDGLRETAVSVLFTIKALDAGNIILQQPFAIEPEENSGHLTQRLFSAGAPLLLEALNLLRNPEFLGQPQDPGQASFCKKIAKSDGKINWSHPVDKLVNEFRAYQPWPGSHCLWQGQRILIEGLSKAATDSIPLAPGMFVLDRKNKALLVGTESSPVWITRLKPAGSKSIDALSFWNGAKIAKHGNFE